ncbi:MAG: hypothetical protein ACRC62_13025 [Microcoleus sp.]
MTTQLRRIPAFGRTMWDKVENILNTDDSADIEEFKNWLEDHAFVFSDRRSFDYHALELRGYTVVDPSQLDDLIDQWCNSGDG